MGSQQVKTLRSNTAYCNTCLNFAYVNSIFSLSAVFGLLRLKIFTMGNKSCKGMGYSECYEADACEWVDTGKYILCKDKPSDRIMEDLNSVLNSVDEGVLNAVYHNIWGKDE